MEAGRHICLFNMAEFYSNAARIIDKVLQKQGTPKALVIENSRIKNKKKLYALVCEAMKCKKCTKSKFYCPFTRSEGAKE